MSLSMYKIFYFLFFSQSFHLSSCSDSFAYAEGISPGVKIRYPVPNVSVNAEIPSQIDRLHGKEVENKFFIKSNTIIRTGESRALGAKYINETRLPSNHDCLTWCLETPSCNAAVFEEKNKHSCYMFDCGSPAKPQCKFTTHEYFTSSVLKMSQHSYELSQWGKEVQLERINTEYTSDVVSSTTSVPSVDASTSTSTPVLPTSFIQGRIKGSLCHHYQFQCVNSTECIAIYNVCDGIPQCPDASDESPELKCPNKDIPQKVVPAPSNRVLDVAPPAENKSPVPKERPSVPPHIPVLYTGVQNQESYKKPGEHQELQRKEDYKGSWANPYSTHQIAKPTYHHRTDGVEHHRTDDSDGLGSPFIHKHSQFISANDPHVQNLNRWASDYDQYSPPHSTSLEQQYNNPYERVEDSYLSNQLPADYEAAVKSFGGYRSEDVPNWPPYQDVVQDASYTADDFPQPAVQNLNKMMGYPDKESAYAQQMARTVVDQYPDTKMSRHKPISVQNQPPDLDDYKLRRYPHSRPQSPYLSMEDSLQQRLSNYPEAKAKAFNPMQTVDDAVYNNNDELIRASLVNQIPSKLDPINHPTHEHTFQQQPKLKIHHFSTQDTIVMEGTETSRDDSLIIAKPTSHTKAIQKTVLDFKMSVAELYESSTTHSHEENSAIVALILGVTISFLLIALLACRIKTLRRRMSRKGRALAHDADYLVNGMYL